MSGEEGEPGPVRLATSTSAPLVVTVPARFQQMEDQLRGSLANWNNSLGNLREQMRPPPQNVPATLKAWTTVLDRILYEVSGAMENLRVIKEDLDAAKAEADYGSVLVTTWPANHYLDRMAYIGTAIVGAGGAAFLVGSGVRDAFPEWWMPAAGLWVFGLILLIYALRGLRDWERQKFAFYAWKLAVPDEYKPRLVKRSWSWRFWKK